MASINSSLAKQGQPDVLSPALSPSTSCEDDGISDVLTNLARPKTAATLTVRVIKSFEFRSEKSLVLHEVDLAATTVDGLKGRVKDAIKTQSGWRAYQALADSEDVERRLDTLKLYTKAHGAKTQNLIINLDHDDWIFEDDTAILADIGFENETEVSFFNRMQYEAFQANPVIRWDMTTVNPAS